ncbi:Cyclin-G-associated kinase [Oopsacas minuta]|uniref:Cyclin-G-associated kinase n=1 Tax=Oopsacas minuta TaxID=111878 RepID=A0AAV7JTT8_9METZ|nr:Cyclin-G-associated kinase [Oopsacas minuta]
MVDKLKNALSNLSAGIGGTSPQDIIGTTIQIPLTNTQEPQQLKIKRILDTGGYGVIYQAQDVRSGQEFAIKRIVISSELSADIKQELSIHKSVTGHPHILPFITAVTQKQSESALVYLIQTELCPLGNLSSRLPMPGTHTYLSLPHIFKFFYQTVQAVSHLHTQSPPIVHRDIKAENLLLDSSENIKLCDFGSATTQFHLPDTTWTATQRGLLQEDLARYTTPMYRAPEMLDLYSNQPIDTRADIWALGCLLYHICFLRHPFQEGSTLPILSAQYFFPVQDSKNKDPLLFQSLIRSLIKTIPEERPGADGIVASLYHYSMQMGIDVEALDKVPRIHNLPPPVEQTLPSAQKEDKPQELKREPSPYSYASGINAFLGRVKGGADNLIKNIKDMSVIRGATYSIVHLTSRLLVSVVPDERNAPIVRDMLDKEHNGSYLIFNLSGVSYDVTVFHGRVADLIWPRNRSTPEFLKMLDMCKQLDAWLIADHCNVVVLQDHPDLVSSVYLVTAYFLYCGLFSNLRAVGSYLTTHLPTPGKITLLPSLRRYYSYLTHLAKDPDHNKPHKNRISINKIRISPCSFAEDSEIVIEILCRDGIVYSSQGEGGLLLPAENAVEFIMEAHLESDIQIRIHSPSNKGLSITTTNRTLVCTLQLYSGYMNSETGHLRFLRKDFDSVSTSSYRLQDLTMTLTFEVLDHEFICPIQSVIPKLINPPACCSSKEECNSFQQLYELRMSNRIAMSQPSDKPASPPLPSPPRIDDVPLISINSEPTQQTDKLPARPKFRDTMDDDSDSSSSSSSSDSSSDGDVLIRHQNNYNTLLGQEYEFNPHFQPDADTATAPVTTQTQSEALEALVENRQQNISPMNDDVILDLTDQALPTVTSQDLLISGMSELSTTQKGSDLVDIFSAPTQSTNDIAPNTDIFSSDILNIDPVMQAQEPVRPVKSSDPWDAFNMNSLSSKSNTLFSNKSAQGHTTPSKENISTSTNQSSVRPNYTSSTSPQPSNRQKRDPFGEILKDTGFPQHDQESHTLNEMNKSNLLEAIGDPDKVQVMEWSKSKQGNIRGLLSSLHEMSWEGVRWKQIGMHDLMETSHVKKAYLKASLAFHPDKHVDSPHQNLARLIVIELNEAHSRFENGEIQHRTF